MPMDFPDLNSLIAAAEIHKFRSPRDGESENDYRRALATHVRPIDLIESHEIRTGRGHDQWTSADKADLFRE